MNVSAAVHYHVSVPAPHDHTLEVEVRFTPEQATTEFRLPVWTPGSYMVREFARYLGEWTATQNGVPCAVRKVDKSTWEVDAAPGVEVAIRYNAWCHELTVRTPHIDDTHAYFTGTNVLVYATQWLARPCTLSVDAPPSWTVFCALDQEDGRFVAPDYDTLADAPVEMGPHEVLQFEEQGIPHRLVLWGSDAVRFDRARLVNDVQRCVRQNAELFGGLPYTRYDFIFHITAEARGGLEHLNATVLATPWKYFETEDGYRDMLALVMHEHFHVWNIKRIRPTGVTPFDYTRENMTTALWIAEGFTSYFDDWHCLRAGLYTTDQYLDLMGRNVAKLLAIPGRQQQSIAGASLDAWIRLYRPDENTPNRTVSYYLKGGIVAWLLDLTIRSRSGGEKSLSDVMRRMWEDWKATGAPYDDRAFGALVQDVTGVDIQPELDAWVWGTEELPVAEVAKTHGLLWSTQPDEHPHWGWDLDGTSPVRVSHVATDGPAARAGIAPGDELVAIDGRKATGASVKEAVRRSEAGREVVVHTFRRGRLREGRLVPAAALTVGDGLALALEPCPTVLLLRNRWLGVETTPAP